MIYTCIDTKPSVPILPETGWKDVPSTSFPEGYFYGTEYNQIITKPTVPILPETG
jgi:hypothetical protein